jgi:hypothetical protein
MMLLKGCERLPQGTNQPGQSRSGAPKPPMELPYVKPQVLPAPDQAKDQQRFR